MKIVFSFTALVLLTACQVYKTTGPAQPNKARDLTPVCHGGNQTLRIESDYQVREHLAHGDTLGQCKVPEQDSEQTSNYPWEPLRETAKTG